MGRGVTGQKGRHSRSEVFATRARVARVRVLMQWCAREARCGRPRRDDGWRAHGMPVGWLRRLSRLRMRWICNSAKTRMQRRRPATRSKRGGILSYKDRATLLWYLVVASRFNLVIKRHDPMPVLKTQTQKQQQLALYYS